ncbi:hypothetical protein FRC03_004317 [Tulasnella sp. 419]|nr:hypothetical protein FRC03_004317 [Tulasnella sp. 419]
MVLIPSCLKSHTSDLLCTLINHSSATSCASQSSTKLYTTSARQSTICHLGRLYVIPTTNTVYLSIINYFHPQWWLLESYQSKLCNYECASPIYRERRVVRCSRKQWSGLTPKQTPSLTAQPVNPAAQVNVPSVTPPIPHPIMTASPST